MLRRQPDRSERRSSALFVAVVIRPTRHQDAVTIGECEIVLRRSAVVLTVEGFHRRQAGLDHPRNQLVALQKTGMGERCDTARAIDDTDHVGWRRSAPWN